MKIALQLEPTEEDIRFAHRVGVRHAVWGGPEAPEGYLPLDLLRRTRDTFAAHGLELGVIENVPVSFYDKAMLGLPGRDEQIENYCRTLRHMGQVGIPVLGYHWMALGGISTNQIRGRGGALERRFDLEDALRAPAAALDWRGPLRSGRPIHLPDVEVSAEQMWANLTYFLRAVLPVAEQAGVRLAAHPDDAPIQSFMGVARVLGSPEALQHLLDVVPSPSNGIDFCQGTVSEMPGVDVVQAIRHFGGQGRIFFAHFRDTRGTVPGFTEVFMDEGDTDMVAAAAAYRDVGFDGLVRADHTPHVIGDRQARRGFAFQVGYMRGLSHGVPAARSRAERAAAGSPALAMTVDPAIDEEVIFAQQLGADEVLAHLAEAAPGGPWDARALGALRNRVERAGLRLAGLDALPCPLRQAVRGAPGGDAQVEEACRLIGCAGEAGIALAGVDWHTAEDAPPADSAAPRLDTLAAFAARVAPVAARAGVRLALRFGPGGAPAPLADAARTQEIARALASPCLGLDLPLCPAGVALQALRSPGLRVFAATLGGAEDPAALWQSQADGDLAAVVRALRSAGCTGPLRPAARQHTADEGGGTWQAAALGLGYLRALLQATAPERGVGPHG